ncbi:hypothetical protein NDU88_007678 [Pleurodeles waltl]|uniref:Uncharacterized protein n=1 Tax=Pleurodeles waltl TaxID=8319 RepID=A0AAV7STF3_PLEWA|nr:hypothetical protein NDU88_007678 [Pleurodeles waltl]
MGIPRHYWTLLFALVGLCVPGHLAACSKTPDRGRQPTLCYKALPCPPQCGTPILCWTLLFALVGLSALLLFPQLLTGGCGLPRTTKRYLAPTAWYAQTLLDSAFRPGGTQCLVPGSSATDRGRRSTLRYKALPRPPQCETPGLCWTLLFALLGPGVPGHFAPGSTAADRGRRCTSSYKPQPRSLQHGRTRAPAQAETAPVTAWWRLG